MPFNLYFKLIRVLATYKDELELDLWWQGVSKLNDHEWTNQIFYRYSGKKSPFTSKEIERLAALFWNEKVMKERLMRRKHPYWWRKMGTSKREK